MSADVPTVILTGPAMAPLVRAAAALAAEDIPPFAVIGGVAVTVRLGRALRATADLDAVTDQRYTPTALEILRGREDTAYDAADPHTITISGAEVQFQDVEPVSEADVSHLDDKDLLYVAAHAHALAAATPVRLLAADAQIEATVPVATTGALLATKLHAYLDRRRVAGPDKRPGDPATRRPVEHLQPAPLRQRRRGRGPRCWKPEPRPRGVDDPSRTTGRRRGTSPIGAPALERRAIPGDHRRGDQLRGRDVPRLSRRAMIPGPSRARS